MLISKNLNRAEIPSLNGLRAFSVLNVVFWHLGFTWVPGGYGVTAFFVISGFLITYLLIRESDKTGDVSLKQFYIRRTLRIFPAFYVFSGIYLVMRVFLSLPIYWPQVIASLLYVRDYYQAIVRPTNLVLGHTWSLAVEEQFYLLWPFVFIRFKRNWRSLAVTLTCVILFVWIYRAVLSLVGVHGDYIYYAFDTRVDALAVGCLLAVLLRCGYTFSWLLQYWQTGAVLLVCLIALRLSDFLQPGFDFHAIVGSALLPVVFGFVILHSIAYAQHPLYWILNNPVARYLGIISYSLYLYHPVVGHLTKSVSPGLRMLGETLLCIGLASGSYFIIEKPFLALKTRLLPGKPQHTNQECAQLGVSGD